MHTTQIKEKKIRQQTKKLSVPVLSKGMPEKNILIINLQLISINKKTVGDPTETIILGLFSLIEFCAF